MSQSRVGYRGDEPSVRRAEASARSNPPYTLLWTETHVIHSIESNYSIILLLCGSLVAAPPDDQSARLSATRLPVLPFALDKTQYGYRFELLALVTSLCNHAQQPNTEGYTGSAKTDIEYIIKVRVF